jgi:sugar (pentulose or hexulose) kinase
MNHCLIFDIGKTNKKAIVFNERYEMVHEQSARLPETTDDDGYPCEDLHSLKQWILETRDSISRKMSFQAVHCTAYGASFVHLDEDLHPVTPLYNYLKPYPEALLDHFMEQYGPANRIALETASPVMGHLNSGLQLYWLKYHKPLIFKKIKHSLHLPQWVAMLLGGKLANEMTSIGCHTMLWDFVAGDYHEWARKEGLDALFPPVTSGSGRLTGLHDSSAALIPYFSTVEEPFMLLSTGTWCITLNPFNPEPLTASELTADCLCYLTPGGKPVKAARYFGGYEHGQAVNDIAERHSISVEQLLGSESGAPWSEYVLFMGNLVEKQATSVRLALGNSGVKKLYVDGGFSRNKLYMNGLSEKLPEMEIIRAEAGQATALGAALAVHAVWNNRPAPENLVRFGETFRPAGLFKS